MFGDFFSLVPNDPYRTIINSRFAENSSNLTYDTFCTIARNIGGSVSNDKLWVARSHLGTGTAVQLAKVGGHAFAVDALVGYLIGSISQWNPADGGSVLSPLWLYDNATGGQYTIRGRLRGLWHFLHPSYAVADGDTVSGTGTFAGRSFLFLKYSATNGIIVIETSDTLETNT